MVEGKRADNAADQKGEQQAAMEPQFIAWDGVVFIAEGKQMAEFDANVGRKARDVSSANFGVRYFGDDGILQTHGEAEQQNHRRN